MHSRWAMVLLLGWTVSASGLAQPLSFFREKITLAIDSATCQVSGEYYFKNTSQREAVAALYYPFPVRSALPYPTDISVFDVTSERVVSYTPSDSGIHFPIQIAPRSIVLYRVDYVQPAPAGEMEYILTTTRLWNRPLELAEFVLHVPRTIECLTHSLPFFPIHVDEKRSSYYCKLEDFMPTQNLHLTWRLKP